MISKRALWTFHTRLGGTAILGLAGDSDGQHWLLERVVFGFDRPEQAVQRITARLGHDVPLVPWNNALVDRLERHAKGEIVDFADVPVELSPLAPFARRVLGCCRQVSYGQCVTYKELAHMAGCPQGARAVGNCMAANPVPLVIPCHRVIASSGGLGGYSAPGGVELKKALLAMEAGAPSHATSTFSPETNLLAAFRI